VRLATNTSNTAFTTDDGTSFASPLTAGVAALYRGQNPSDTVPQVKTAILSAAISGKLTGYLGPVGNVAPNLFLAELRNELRGYRVQRRRGHRTCASDCPNDGGW